MPPPKQQVTKPQVLVEFYTREEPPVSTGKKDDSVPLFFCFLNTVSIPTSQGSWEVIFYFFFWVASFGSLERAGTNTAA